MSSMPEETRYSSFAVAGAGGIGTLIVQELVKTGASVILLTRPSTTPKAGIPTNVKIIPVEDYNDITSLTQIFREHKVEVVITTLNGPAIELQIPIADAAKAAGVGLFVPSKFGSVGGAQESKKRVTGHLKAIGLPAAAYYVGFFYEYIPWLGGLNESLIAPNSFTVIGNSHKVPLSATSMTDIAGFVSYTLTTLPPSSLADRNFRIQGERPTLALIAEKLGKQLRVVEELEKEEKDRELKAFLMKGIEVGIVSTGWDLDSGKEDVALCGKDNGVWESHRWLGLMEVLKA